MSEKTFVLIKAIPDDIKIGRHKDFVCPICNGRAIALRPRFDGHLYAKCNNCNTTLRRSHELQ